MTEPADRDREMYDEAIRRASDRFAASYIIPSERKEILREEGIAAIAVAREAGRQEERKRCAAIARNRGLRSHKDFRWMAEEIEREIEAGTEAESTTCSCGGTIIFDDANGIARCLSCGSAERYTYNPKAGTEAERSKAG